MLSVIKVLLRFLKHKLEKMAANMRPKTYIPCCMFIVHEIWHTSISQYIFVTDKIMLNLASVS